jgi:hypothetical protein
MIVKSIEIVRFVLIVEIVSFDQIILPPHPPLPLKGGGLGRG